MKKTIILVVDVVDWKWVQCLMRNDFCEVLVGCRADLSGDFRRCNMDHCIP